MVYLLGRSITGGRKAGLAAVLGINLGGYVHLTAAVLGLSAIIATSAFAFSIVKWVGALYLIYIGITTLINKSKPIKIKVDSTGGHISSQQALQSIFWQGFISDVLNPKVAIFFLALLPQFVVESAQNKTEQLLILGVTSNMIAIVINTLIVYLSSRITIRLRANNRIASWLNNAMGSIFILLGVRLASEKI